MVIHKHVGARVGLIGNPSDGFGGKTIAALIDDFSASVTAWESPQIDIMPHPRFDPFSFRSLDHLVSTAALDGYYGGLRLMYATCKRFHDYCAQAHIYLPRRNFSLEYDTNIPRQVGLAGSSAITVATLQALIELFDVDEGAMPMHDRPTLALEVETRELHIQAGLQDRVVQVYGGLVYMDFNPELVQEQGHPQYTPLDLNLLPPLYLGWSDEPSDSGRIHSRIAARFADGDPVVHEGMRQFARFTDEGREALESGNLAKFATLMNATFDLRRTLYGDEWIGPRNLQMIETAREAGLPATFPGSGGAIVGFYEDDRRFRNAQRAFEKLGFKFKKISPVQRASGGHLSEARWQRLHDVALPRVGAVS